MKRIYSCLILLILCQISFAQDTKLSFNLLKRINEAKSENEHISVLIKGNINYLKEAIPQYIRNRKICCWRYCSC